MAKPRRKKPQARTAVRKKAARKARARRVVKARLAEAEGLPRVGAGRPTKWTADTEAAILHVLRIGLTHQVAADFVGIHRDTLQAKLKEDPEFSYKAQRAGVEGLILHAGQLAVTKDPVRLAAARFYLGVHAGWVLRRHHHITGGLTLAELLSASDKAEGADEGDTTDEDEHDSTEGDPDAGDG